jgi:predicted nuclease with TOPRIM domain
MEDNDINKEVERLKERVKLLEDINDLRSRVEMLEYKVNNPYTFYPTQPLRFDKVTCTDSDGGRVVRWSSNSGT